MKPRLGDCIGTVGHLWPPQSAVVTLGIQAAQRFGRWDGIPHIPSPYWRITHSMAYVGSLDPLMIRSAVELGSIPVKLASELVTRDDWMLSVTHPVGKWERYAAVEKREHYISRPLFCGFEEEWQRRAFESTCWWWIHRKYDIGQLFTILADMLGEVSPQKYSRLFDASPWRTVCSGAVASVYEAVRRRAICDYYGGPIPEWIDTDLPTWPNGGGPTWWPRILNGLHLERVAPGHLCLEGWFDVQEGQS